MTEHGTTTEDDGREAPNSEAPPASGNTSGRKRSGSSVANGFWSAIIGLFAITLVAALIAKVNNRPNPSTPAATTPDCGPIGPLSPQDQNLVNRLAREILDSLIHGTDETTGTDLRTAITTQIDAAFEPAYANIPRFLDRHYSVTGQYAELALAAQGSLEEGIATWLFPSLEADLVQAMSNISSNLDSILRMRIQELLRNRMPPNRPSNGSRCGAMDGRIQADAIEAAIEDTVARFKMSVGPTMAGGVAAAGAAKALTTALTKKIAGTMMGKAILKILLKIFGPAAGAALGSIGGPVGTLIGLVAGAGAWIAADAAIVEIDEQLTRDKYEAELRKHIDEKKREIVEAMTQNVRTAAERTIDGLTPAELGNQG